MNLRIKKEFYIGTWAGPYSDKWLNRKDFNSNEVSFLSCNSSDLKASYSLNTVVSWKYLEVRNIISTLI